jgi:CRP-like cAMP-binding protein
MKRKEYIEKWEPEPSPLESSIFTFAEKDDIEALIKNSYLFQVLDEEAKKTLLKSVKLRLFKRGEIIIQEGEKGDKFYLIKSGRVRVSTKREGQEVVLTYMGQGDVLGEVAVLTGTLRTATCTAQEEVQALEFSKESIGKILNLYPKIKEIILDIILERARDTIEKIKS